MDKMKEEKRLIGQRSNGNNMNKKHIVLVAVGSSTRKTTATLQDNIEVPHTRSVI